VRPLFASVSLSPPFRRWKTGFAIKAEDPRVAQTLSGTGLGPRSDVLESRVTAAWNDPSAAFSSMVHLWPGS